MNTISGHCLCRMIAFSYEGAPNWTLRYEDRDILVEHRHHVDAEDLVHLGVAQAEVAQETEEVVRGALGLRRRRAERHQVDPSLGVLAAGEIHREARRHVLDDLPAIDVAGEAAGVLVEG